MILSLAVWFGLHVAFDEVRNVTGYGFDLPVLSTPPQYCSSSPR